MYHDLYFADDYDKTFPPPQRHWLLTYVDKAYAPHVAWLSRHSPNMTRFMNFGRTASGRRTQYKHYEIRFINTTASELWWRQQATARNDKGWVSRPAVSRSLTLD